MVLDEQARIMLRATKNVQLQKNIRTWFRLLLAEINSGSGNINKEVLENTPDRVAKAYVELLDGYDQDPHEILKTFEVPSEKGVAVYEVCEFYSRCEHHMLPFFGKVHIGYISKTKCFGLSKLARLVDVYAHRLQIQERLTQQIADALWHELLPGDGVYVAVEGRHLCMMMRGIKKQDSVTITKAYHGCYEHGEDAHRQREEFLMILRSKKVKI